MPVSGSVHLFGMGRLRCVACGTVNKQWEDTPAELAAQVALLRRLAARYRQMAIQGQDPNGTPTPAGAALSRVARELSALVSSLGGPGQPFPLPEINLAPWSTGTPPRPPDVDVPDIDG